MLRSCKTQKAIYRIPFMAFWKRQNFRYVMDQWTVCGEKCIDWGTRKLFGMMELFYICGECKIS